MFVRTLGIKRVYPLARADVYTKFQFGVYIRQRAYALEHLFIWLHIGYINATLLHKGYIKATYWLHNFR